MIALMQDKEGWIYAGTFEGLARYDGRSWQTLELPTDGRRYAVGALAQAGDGSIWVGTDSEGLWRGVGRGRDIVFERVPLSDPEAVNAFYPADDRSMWVGTGAGLERCQANVCARVDALRGVGVRSLLVESENGEAMLWLGTNGEGVWRLRNLDATPSVSAAPITRDHGLPNNVGLSMVRFAGDLWIGTGRGLARMHDDQLVVYGAGNGFPVAMVFALQPGPAGDGRTVLFASLRPGGLARIDADGSWQLIDGEHGLPSNAAHALLLEKYRNLLWIGTMTAGIARMERDRWALFDERSGLPDRLVLGVGRGLDPDSLWVGTARGPVIWHNGQFHPMLPSSHGGELVYDMIDVPDGTRWVAHGQGLQRWRGSTLLEDFTVDNSALPAVSADRLALRRLSMDAYELYVGSGHGLARWRADEGLHRVRSLPDDMVDGPIKAITVEPASDATQADLLWVVGGRGIVRLDGEQWSRVDATCLQGQSTFGLTVERVDSGHLYWVSTRDGLFQIDPDGVCTIWSAANRLGTLSHVQRAGESLFVFGTRGVLQLDRHGPPDQSGVWFGAQSGLASPEMTSSTVDAWGRLFAAGAGGLAALSPDTARRPAGPAPLHLLSAEFGAPAQPLLAGSVLPPDQASIHLRIALIAFERESQVRYRTRVLGLHDLPGPWTPESEARFERLPPGDFELLLEARDADGVEARPIRIPFRVDRPWWQSPWSLLGGALLLVAVGLSLGRWRLAAARQRARTLEDQVDERTRELAAANARLEEASFTDPLTGLRNRRFFALAAPAEAERARRAPAGPGLLVAVMDIDHFKAINDTHGHDGGDQVLVEVARRLQSVARSGDFVLRWGGEEFLLLCRDVRADEAATVVLRLLTTLCSSPIQTGDHSLRVTASIGAVTYPLSLHSEAAATLDRAISLADAALYRAKHAGRGLGILVEPAADASDWVDIEVRVDAPA
ncbi:MAG: diguanylate cyclase [Xanthomonadales bacterium]|nr:diguanylate cyclase [Xanthomonadales bacterium]